MGTGGNYPPWEQGAVSHPGNRRQLSIQEAKSCYSFGEQKALLNLGSNTVVSLPPWERKGFLLIPKRKGDKAVLYSQGIQRLLPGLKAVSSFFLDKQLPPVQKMRGCHLVL
jgi:hypothetical protein